jgi:hypothetical protein
MKDEHFSGLTARFSLESVDNVQATLTLTATVSFWKQAAEKIKDMDGYGAWQIRAAIRELIAQSEKHFYHRVPAAHE